MSDAELLKLELEHRRRLTASVEALPFRFSGSVRGVIRAARLLAESEAAFRRYTEIDVGELAQALGKGSTSGGEALVDEFRQAGEVWRKADMASLDALESLYLTPRSRRRLLVRLRRKGYRPRIHGRIDLDEWGE